METSFHCCLLLSVEGGIQNERNELWLHCNRAMHWEVHRRLGINLTISWMLTWIPPTLFHIFISLPSPYPVINWIKPHQSPKELTTKSTFTLPLITFKRSGLCSGHSFSSLPRSGAIMLGFIVDDKVCEDSSLVPTSKTAPKVSK